jgi:hypothetical protein
MSRFSLIGPSVFKAAGPSAACPGRELLVDTDDYLQTINLTNRKQRYQTYTPVYDLST